MIDAITHMISNRLGIKLIIAALWLLPALGVAAQSVDSSVLACSKAMIMADPCRAANYHHVYEPLNLNDTPAPEGFTAFYISHLGRHGSRYSASLNQYDRSIRMLQEYADKWGLSKDGKRLLTAMKQMRKANDGHLGELSARGAEEHRAIARRMQARFADVFSQPGRRVLRANSTNVKRVQDSRAAFLSQFSGFEIDQYYKKEGVSGPVISDTQNKEFKALGHVKFEVPVAEDLCDMSRLVAKTFKKAPADFDAQQMYKLFSNTFNAACVRKCIGVEIPLLDNYFTPEEAYTFWYNANPGVFNDFCISAENQGVKARARACSILAGIVSDADAAIAGNAVAADFRFSHDTYVQPVLCLIAAEGNTYVGTAANANEHFCAFTSVPMGVNIQLIFYQDAQGAVLVKMLHNEREVLIPALKPYQTCYYEWPALREYLISKTKQ